MLNTNTKKWVYRFAALSLGLATSMIVGCGKANNDGAAGAPGAPGAVNMNNMGLNCAANQTVIGGQCVNAGEVIARCSGYGMFVVNDGSRQLCFSYRSGYLSNQLAAALPDGSPTSGTYVTAIRAGAQVHIEVNGTWGPVQVSSSTTKFLGIPITTFSSSCAEISPDGVKSDGTQLKSGSMNAGVTASDSSKVYFIGDAGDFTASVDGALRVGVNAPSMYNTCVRMNGFFSIKECVDNNGASAPCPANIPGF